MVSHSGPLCTMFIALQGEGKHPREPSQEVIHLPGHHPRHMGERSAWGFQVFLWSEESQVRLCFVKTNGPQRDHYICALALVLANLAPPKTKCWELCLRLSLLMVEGGHSSGTRTISSYPSILTPSERVSVSVPLTWPRPEKGFSTGYRTHGLGKSYDYRYIA